MEKDTVVLTGFSNSGAMRFSTCGNPFSLWHKIFLWSLPNYVIGAGLTAIASALSTTSGLVSVTYLMAVLFALYQSYKVYVGRTEQTQPKVMAMAAGR